MTLLVAIPSQAFAYGTLFCANKAGGRYVAMTLDGAFNVLAWARLLEGSNESEDATIDGKFIGDTSLKDKVLRPRPQDADFATRPPLQFQLGGHDLILAKDKDWQK